MPRTLKAASVTLFRVACNAVYRMFCLVPRKDLAIFVSRQANEPTRDFIMVGEEFERRGYQVAYLTQKLSKKTVFLYIAQIVRELRQLARCRVCFLDRYDPVVSLLDFDCDPVDADLLRGQGLHSSFPREPIVVQLWHAFGAFKYFGYQSLDTKEGHPSDTAELFGIHRNYSWIICTGEGCRRPFAQAFGCPVERVVPLGRPEYSVLMQEARRVRDTGPDALPSVLFAPTLRKSKESRHPLRELYRNGLWKTLEGTARVSWSFHPLEETGIAPGDVNELLLEADYVVTDYSSIVYEAYLLGKRVVFYIPDIDQYEASPGLNVNPKEMCPEISFGDEESLVGFINDAVSGKVEYPTEAFERFVGDVFDKPAIPPVQAIADFVLDKVGRGSGATPGA